MRAWTALSLPILPNASTAFSRTLSLKSLRARMRAWTALSLPILPNACAAFQLTESLESLRARMRGSTAWLDLVSTKSSIADNWGIFRSRDSLLRKGFSFCPTVLQSFSLGKTQIKVSRFKLLPSISLNNNPTVSSWNSYFTAPANLAPNRKSTSSASLTTRTACSSPSTNSNINAKGSVHFK